MASASIWRRFWDASSHGFDQGGGFLDSCRQDPVLSRVKLIAEPWDCGPGGYQVGGFPPGWAEWNDKFRDTVRAYWKGDAGMLPQLATRLTGSGDLFNRRGRRPWASVNFVTAHDGFTLADLVSYNEKHNKANGEDNKDGHSHNISWNHGVEGPTDDPEITALRLRQMRNMLATLLLSQGTPMLLAGDEFARSQNGNNNAYCQDNAIGWIDWDGMGDDGAAMIDFVRKLVALRQSHPLLRRGRFLTGAVSGGVEVKDVTWLTPAGIEKTTAQWQDPIARCLGMLLDGRAQATGVRRTPSDATLLLIVNAHHGVVPFRLPDTAGGSQWLRLLDTVEPDRLTVSMERSGDDIAVAGRSLLLFERMPDRRSDTLAGDTVTGKAPTSGFPHE